MKKTICDTVFRRWWGRHDVSVDQYNAAYIHICVLL